jgi:rubrerythrin
MAIFRASEIVEMAMELEKSGELFYDAVAKKAVSDEVRALFEDLAEEERHHYGAFQKLTRATWDQSPTFEGDWDQYLTYLRATLDSTFFEGSDKALSLADQVSDEQEALQMALGFEKETMLFYFDLRDKVASADRSVVERIIAEEKRHVQRLSAMLLEG